MISTEEEYLSRQLITYIGNKRSLLSFIGQGVGFVQKKLGGRMLSVLDAFSGSGVVTRYFKSLASRLVVNDLELYSRVINQCYLANVSDLPMAELERSYGEISRRLETEPLRPGLISEFYAPQDDQNIQPGERVFYSVRNARFLDTARQYIGELPLEFQPYFLGPLLAEASVHANTGGVFKGFYKNSRTGLGAFGGQKGDALPRILGNIQLPFPLFSSYECPVEIHQKDIMELVKQMEPVDLAYLDPPYNQHPYGSNYFMLNLLAEYRRPGKISEVSGIPVDWNRSVFNQKNQAVGHFQKLLEALPARFVLISFNSEGFISRQAMESLISALGDFQTWEWPYNAYRASRNLKGRGLHVKEFLYLLEKKP